MRITKAALLSLAVSIGCDVSYAAVVTGQMAPDFKTTDTQGKAQSLSQYKGKYVVLEWKNHGCPFVKKHYDSNNMQKLQSTYTAKGVVWLSINSSAKGKEGSVTAAEANQELATYKSAPSAVILDADGKIGMLYEAKTTPHMYVINPEGKLIYQGAIDSKASVDSADISSSTNYVAKALDEAMAGKTVTTPETKSYGCGVKYKN